MLVAAPRTLISGDKVRDASPRDRETFLTISLANLLTPSHIDPDMVAITLAINIASKSLSLTACETALKSVLLPQPLEP
jgi:hypothetical protein